jgi:parallel beta-helix repeat protein
VKITGALTGIFVRGNSAPLIASSQITNNLGSGIVISPPARPRIFDNLIAGNGAGKPGPMKPGIEVLDRARPTIKNNGIIDNGAESVWLFGHTLKAVNFEENFFGAAPPRQAIKEVAETQESAKTHGP